MVLPMTTMGAAASAGAATSHDAAPVPSDRTTGTTPTALHVLEMDAWMAYMRTRSDLITALERDLAETDLTLGDYQVFVSLSSAEDQAMRMCDLADALQLSPSGLTRRLDGLVKAGLIERRSSEQDRRVMLAVMTPRGRRRFDEAVPIHVASVRDRVTGLLDERELVMMAAIFGKIRGALDDGADRTP